MIRFCTYLDGRYAARAVVMLRSLFSVEPGADVMVLALDERARAIAPHVPQQARFLRLAELLEARPQLVGPQASAPERGRLMALKPVWLSFALERTPPGERLTYVDADMLFLAPPAEALEEAADASITLSPQRFSGGRSPEAFWGRFNAGWLGLRHDATARAFLEGWERDCIGRMSPAYSNQKFLDQAAARYPGVHVLQHPGVNVAHWNVGAIPISEVAGEVHAGGRPLIAYHMAGLFPLAPGLCVTGVRRAVLKGALRERVYRPYLRDVKAAALEMGLSAPAALGRVDWPATPRERWMFRLSLWLGCLRGEAVHL